MSELNEYLLMIVLYVDSLARLRETLQTKSMFDRAGTVALPEDLTDIDALISAYYDIEPDPSNPDQRVSFGTSGHRGSAFDGKFNEAHIVAITQAIVDYRAEQGFNGPLFYWSRHPRTERTRMANRSGSLGRQQG